MKALYFFFNFYKRQKIRLTYLGFLFMLPGFLVSTHAYAQLDSVKVFDRFGKTHSLESIRIPAVQQGIQTTNTVTCAAGYFNLVFTDGNSGFNNSTNGNLFRDVACRVFTDLSKLIIPANNPYTGLPNTTPFVNISLHMYYGSDPLIAGIGTSYYNDFSSPMSLPPSNKGLVDGEVWKTINGGFDSYLAYTTYFTYDQFFHGDVAVNFSPGFTWNLDYSIATPGSSVDLYTVLIHEAIHTLGFASFLSATGTSTGGGGFYSRYDSHLYIDSSGTLVPILNHVSSCDSLAYSGVTYGTGCSTRFIGTTNEPVTTGNPYSGGQSFMHFEENCPPGTPYVMCNGGPPGITRRHPSQQDIDALCDLHYHTTNTYGVSGTGFDNYVNTYTPCGNRVAGVNDIFKFGTHDLYIYTDCPGNGPITLNDFLLNDEDETSVGGNPVTYDCLTLMTGNGTITNATATTFEYKTAPGFNGWSVIKYIPVGQSGQRGNLSFIYILTMPCSDCDSSCNIVEFGDFEKINNSFLMPMSNFRITSSNSPDLFGWNGSNWVVYPTWFSSTTWGVGCYGSNIAVPPSWSGVGNNRYGGLAGVLGQNIEGMTFRLCHPLIPGSQYTLKFYGTKTASTCPANVNFYASALPPCMSGFGATDFSGSNNCSGSVAPFNYTLVASQLVNTSVPTWSQYTIPFTYTPSVGNANAYYLTLSLTPNPYPGFPYLLIDDITIPCSGHVGMSSNTGADHGISVYPNPATDLLSIQINDLTGGDFNIHMTNTLGQTLRHKEINATKNLTEIQFDMKDLPGGIYFLTVRSDKTDQTFKILKL